MERTPPGAGVEGGGRYRSSEFFPLPLPRYQTTVVMAPERRSVMSTEQTGQEVD